jgi:lipoyl(octanoyl) transferase
VLFGILKIKPKESVAMTVEWIISDDLVPYEDAVTEMERRVAAIERGEESEAVWLLQHPPLYTAGTGAQESDLLSHDRFPVYKTGRGGQFTYHGPGQRVGYVMLDLRARGRDVRAYVNKLEQLVIDTLASFNVTGERREGRVGVWVDHGDGREEKIGALGVRVRRWVTFHGFSINVHPDLGHFDGIVPCGLPQYGVTSLEKLGLPVSMADVDVAIRQSFENIFD